MKKNNSIIKVTIISLILLVSLSFWGFAYFKNSSSKPTKAILQVDGETVAEYNFKDYDKPTLISLKQYGIDGEIEIKNGAVRFSDMDCKDKICIKTSWVTKVTESAVCLPNKVYLTVK